VEEGRDERDMENRLQEVMGEKYAMRKLLLTLMLAVVSSSMMI